jgi:pimeloyl-ACP methyl ester carboxylesterase
MKNQLFKASLLFTLFVFVVSCQEEEVAEKKVLVSSSLFLTRSASELQTFISVAGIDLPLSELVNDVEIYKVTYTTPYKGEDITASGLVILPKTNSPVGILSFQHGTIAAHNQAPTALALNSSELILYAALASPGFIAVIPDFIGFGASAELMHPYYVEDLTASAILDNIRAGKELAAQKGVRFNQKLFLAGYSQGGYATMATHKAIEENGFPGYDLIASFPAAGGYDVKGVQEYFFSLETYDEPFFLPYVAYAYQTAFDWTQPLTNFFNEPYANQIPSLFDGTKSGGTINQQLTTSILGLVNNDLLENIDTDPKYSYIVDAFNENSLVDFTPTIPVFMYHGSADITVPYQNSVTSYAQYIQNGASTNTVQFFTLEGATHYTGFFPYAEDFVPRLLQLK